MLRDSFSSASTATQKAALTTQYYPTTLTTPTATAAAAACVPMIPKSLGPLESLTQIDMCVEGLVDVTLLRRCKNLRKLSLNGGWVGRSSWPGYLTAWICHDELMDG